MGNDVTRRDFFRLGAGSAILGAGVTLGLTCSTKDAHQSPVLDAHIHIPSEDGFIWQWHPVMKNMQDVVDYLDQVGVDRGIINSVHAIRSAKPEDFVKGNREVLKHCETYRGRFIPGMIVNGNFPDESIQEIEELHDNHGVLWIGELCNYAALPRYEYGSEGMDRVFRRAIELKMVLHVHSANKELESHMSRYPDGQFVIPHFGGSPEDIFERIGMVAAHKKACFEISGYGMDRMGILEYAVQHIGEDRVIFGSDLTINDPSAGIARVVNAYLTDRQKEKILHENTERLLAEAAA